MTELKLKKLLVGLGVAAAILMMAVGAIYYQIHAREQKFRLIQLQDISNIRQFALGVHVFHSDENGYPENMLDLYPDYIDAKSIFQSSNTPSQSPEPYIYLPPAFNSFPKSIQPKTIILISPIDYPRGKRVVGYANGAVKIVSEKDLPDLKNHSPAN